MIELFYAPTPNGWKAAIMLEETGLPYEPRLVALAKGEQFTPEFLAVSPNARIPAIRDPEPLDVYGPEPVTVFESGAILLYLAEKAGRFVPTGARALKEMQEWLFWQVGNQGPMGGQLSHFRNYAPAGEDYSHTRYRGEFERSLAVLDRRLETRPYILGAEYTIADIIAFPWAFIAKPLGVPLDPFPAVADWRGRIKVRPAVRRAIDLHKDRQNTGRETAETAPVLYNQSAEHFRRPTS